MINRLFTLIGMVLLLAGCTSEDDLSDILSGSDKTPLVLNTSLSTQHIITRAANDAFAATDELHVYVQHVKKTGVDTYESIKADQAPLLVSFSGENPLSLYWDDLSDSRTSETYLRTPDHALRTLYGYCYNGGTPTTFNEETGVLEWPISAQQTSAEAVQHADLLWSGTQEPVTYDHTNLANNKLQVPFTHAMSEITVTVKTGNGYTGNPLSATVLTLKGMNTIATLDAPQNTISSQTPENINMCGSDYTDGGMNRSYTAIVAPGTKLKVGDELLSIVNVDDNNYSLIITAGMLGTDSWAKDNTLKTDDGTYIETLPGVNYHIDVTVNKTAVDIEASLKNWTTVTANGTGDITFENDIKTYTIDDNGVEFGDKASFTLYWKKNAENEDYKKATTSTYDATEKSWTNDPAIYWPNGLDSYYFRALSGITGTDVKQGDDVLWGTTAAHTGYDKGAAINPRTGDVPLVFRHAMSNVVINLKTTDDNSKVDLTDAKVTLTKLYTGGKIDIASGVITSAATKTEMALNETTSFGNLFMIPQAIDDETKLIITLSDGTSYSLQLNNCTDGDNAPITNWTSGNKYIYTIALQKEAVKFRALVEPWKDNTGSGNATLDWD